MNSESAHPTVSALRQLLPAASCAGFSFATRLPDPAALSESSRREILTSARNAAGDECVSELLRLQGISSKGITNEVGGNRRWPDRFTGSLSYKETVVIGVLAPCSQHSMLGIDLESLSGPAILDSRAVIAPEGVPAEVDQALAVLCAFSVKEAVFKAQYPVTGFRLDFSDVRLHWSSLDSLRGSGTAQCPGNRLIPFQLVVTGQWVVSVASQK